MQLIIRLLDSHASDMIDSVASDYEDSFSLDSFGDSCLAHFDSEPKHMKGFIIARVQTLDPKQPDKAFYSYYNAYYLNKILFQTQLYLKKKFIHRLHVLNPLTNTDIIGDVLYYIVKPTSKNLASIEEYKQRTSSVDSKEQSKSIDKGKGEQIQLSDNVGNDMTNNWTFGNHIITVDTDQTENMVSSPFRGSLTPTLSGIKLREEGTGKFFEVPITKYSNLKPNRSRSLLTVVTKLPDSVVHVNDFNKKLVTPGVITQFSVPIDHNRLTAVIPKSQKSQRRALSYRNAISASGVPASFLEWVKMIQADEDRLNGDIDEDYDTILPTVFNKLSANDPVSQDESEKSPFYIDAIYCGTDNDYLCSSDVRQMFRDNCIDIEGSKLFEMAEVTEVPGEDEEVGNNCEFM
ncbi:hypothetical protein BC833DRAFT_605471 [Globomyces pollinis-pini]|nr:hypothetical protein BC833DRAFT_605471 [Globomyces pollinis-pini]